MIQKDSVKERLNNREQGISYTEFSYMILQSYDFLHLFQKQQVTIQMGASDQWGNIVAGADLVRRLHPQHSELSTQHSVAFGLTTPLLTKSDGTKYGKTESGTIWLTAGEGRTSPYAFYQFLLNIPDEDVERFLKTFTFLTQDQISALMLQQKDAPGARPAQRRLAQDVTRMLHGETELLHAEKAAAALFSGDIADLPQQLLEEAFAAAPSSAHPRAQLEGEGLPLLDLVASTLCKSKSEARQSLTEGAISVNGVKAALTDRITAARLLHGSVILLRRGKKTWHVTRWA
jgi:tyrosyl-tRNA synthetase